MGKECQFCNIHYRPRLKYPESESISTIGDGTGGEIRLGVDRFGIYVTAAPCASSKKFHLDFCPKCGRQLRVYKENPPC